MFLRGVGTELCEQEDSLLGHCCGFCGKEDVVERSVGSRFTVIRVAVAHCTVLADNLVAVCASFMIEVEGSEAEALM
uniref:Uncharacterized protein n=1 Tax=Setaria digitata TaxID=48799 RepID=A0A915Q6Z4_9BILA